MKLLLTRLNITIAIVLSVIFVFGYILLTPVSAHVTTDVPTVTTNTYRHYDFFASSTAQTDFATTTSATSTNINAWTTTVGAIDRGYFVIAGAKDVEVYFSRDAGAGSNGGSTRFSIQSSRDGNTWEDYNMLQAVTVTSTADGYLTRVGTSTITAATTTNMFRMDAKSFYAIRCIVVETTDGSHKCSASATF